MIRSIRYLVRAGMIALCVVLVVSGCGGDPRPATTTAGSSDAGETDDAPVGDARQPKKVTMRVANAISRRLDALVVAYSPISARINFLVSADTLRTAAVDSSAGVDVELERTGLVRVEIGRMRTVLAAARPKVAGVRASSNVQRRLQRLMLRAIDSRQLALDQLEFALDGVAGKLGDRVVDERFDRWRVSWNESLRAAREATTLLQDERARIGLEPSPEESIR